MRVLQAAAGIAILFIVMLDAFETVVLPRRATRRIRLARIFYRMTWKPWRAIGRTLHRPKRANLSSPTTARSLSFC